MTLIDNKVRMDEAKKSDLLKDEKMQQLIFNMQEADTQLMAKTHLNIQLQDIVIKKKGQIKGLKDLIETTKIKDGEFNHKYKQMDKHIELQDLAIKQSLKGIEENQEEVIGLRKQKTKLEFS